MVIGVQLCDEISCARHVEEDSDLAVGQVMLAIWSFFEQPETGTSTSLCAVVGRLIVEPSSNSSKKLHCAPRRRQFPHPGLIASH